MLVFKLNLSKCCMPVAFEVLSEQVHFGNPTVLQWIKKYQEPDLHYPLMVLFPIVHKT